MRVAKKSISIVIIQAFFLSNLGFAELAATVPDNVAVYSASELIAAGKEEVDAFSDGVARVYGRSVRDRVKDLEDAGTKLAIGKMFTTIIGNVDKGRDEGAVPKKHLENVTDAIIAEQVGEELSAGAHAVGLPSDRLDRRLAMLGRLYPGAELALRASPSATASVTVDQTRVIPRRYHNDKLNYGFDRKRKAFTDTYVTYNVGPWVKKDGNGVIPRQFTRLVQKYLNRLGVNQGKLNSITVDDFGAKSIDIHATHNYGENNVDVHQLIYTAVIEALYEANQKGLYQKATIGRRKIDVLNLPFNKHMELFQVQNVEKSCVERGSEPLVIARGVGAGPGAANIILFNQFAIPGATPMQKLNLAASPGFRFVVQRTQHINEGRPDPDEWEFTISEKKTKSQKEKADQNTLQQMVSQPNDYQLVAVYPAKGSKLPSDEPLAVVSHQHVYADGKIRSSDFVILYRSQNAADAVGAIAGIAANARLVPGGENSEYYVATVPTTLSGARKAPKTPGTGHIVVFGHQSRNDGEIPHEGRRDHMAMNPPAYGPRVEMAEFLGKHMAIQGEHQPFLSPQAAERRVRKLREKQDHLFINAPKDTDPDRFLDLMIPILQAGGVVVGDNKADMSGMWGHNEVPPLLVAIYMATLQEAIEKGEILDGNSIGKVGMKRVTRDGNFSIGDDGHLLMIGNDDVYGKAMKHLAFKAFTRAYYFADRLGKKFYGIGQDFQGVEAKVAMEHPAEYSRLTPRFFEILEEIIPFDEMGEARLRKHAKGTAYLRELVEVESIGQRKDSIDIIRADWERAMRTGVEERLKVSFSGNVTAQGIGSAQYVFDPKKERTFDMIAGDKMGPPAYNPLFQDAVFDAVDSGKFGAGLVFEIWDLKAEGDEAALKQATADVPAKRIFLDAVKDREAIMKYLAHSDRYNVRNIWQKSKRGFNKADPLGYLDRILASSTVTRLGLLAEGAYVGKDDPVIIGNTKLMKFFHARLQTRIYIVQGDMNGSHWEPAVTTALKYAIANVRSHPILVGLRYTVSKDGKKFTKVDDLYADKKYNKIRRTAYKFGEIFNTTQLGQFEPHAANVRSVEPAYPLAKELREVTKPDSPYLVKNMKIRGENRKPSGNVARDLYLTIERNIADQGGQLALRASPAGSATRELSERRSPSGERTIGEGSTAVLDDDRPAETFDITTATEGLKISNARMAVDMIGSSSNGIDLKGIVVIAKTNLADTFTGKVDDAEVRYLLGRHYNVLKGRLGRIFNNGDGIIEVDNARELAEKIRELREEHGKAEGLKIVVLDDGELKEGLSETSLADDTTKDFAIVKAEALDQLDKASFQNLNLFPLTIVGVALLSNKPRLFNRAYEAFHGSAPDADLFDSVRSMDQWFLSIVPMIVRYTNEQRIQKELRALFDVAA